MHLEALRAALSEVSPARVWAYVCLATASWFVIAWLISRRSAVRCPNCESANNEVDFGDGGPCIRCNRCGCRF